MYALDAFAGHVTQEVKTQLKGHVGLAPSIGGWCEELFAAGAISVSPDGDVVLDPKVRKLITALHATLAGYSVNVDVPEMRSVHFEKLEALFEVTSRRLAREDGPISKVLPATEAIARYQQSILIFPGADAISLMGYIFHSRNALDDSAAKLATAWMFRLAAEKVDSSSELSSLPPGAALQCMCLCLSVLQSVKPPQMDTWNWRQHCQLVSHPSWCDSLPIKNTGHPSHPEDIIEQYSAHRTDGNAAMSAALYAGCGERDAKHYRLAANHTRLMTRILSDVRQCFGPVVEVVPSRPNVLVACFEAVAPVADKSLLATCLEKGALDRVRTILYESGAVSRLADFVDRFRTDIHSAIAATGQSTGGHRMWLHAVDSLAGKLFPVPTLDVSRHIQQPVGGRHDEIREDARRVIETLSSIGLPEPPPLLPWHLPQWMYDFQRGVVLYPDVEEYTEEILSFYRDMLAEDDNADVREFVRESTPVVLAHELFHYWRHASGNMSKDFWYEEWVASGLVVAFVRSHYTSRLSYVKATTERMIENHGSVVSMSGERLLEALFEQGFAPKTDRTTYGFDILEIAVLQARMTAKFLDNPLKLEEAINRFLSRKDIAHDGAI